MNKHGRYSSIDILKCVCAFLVILIHAEYPYKLEILPLTNLAVPTFFCISGFFAYNRLRKIGRIMKIAKILFWALLIFYVKTVVVQLCTKHLFYTPTSHDIYDFIVYNDVSFANHLWYLSAYIYVLILAYILNSRCIYFIPLILLGSLIHYYAIENSLSEHIYRNAILQGLPYFSIGALVNELMEHNKLKIRKAILFLGVTLTLVISYVNLPINNLLINVLIGDMNRLLLVVCVFLLVISVKNTESSYISKLGRDYSLYIYVFHPLPMLIMQAFINRFDGILFITLSCLNPFFIMAICIIATKYLKKYRLMLF